MLRTVNSRSGFLHNSCVSEVRLHGGNGEAISFDDIKGGTLWRRLGERGFIDNLISADGTVRQLAIALKQERTT